MNERKLPVKDEGGRENKKRNEMMTERSKRRNRENLQT